MTMTTGDNTMDRLEDQIKWYERASGRSKLWFFGLKIIEVGAAALIPLAAGLGSDPTLTGSLGVLVVLLEGLQHLFQFHATWIGYRSTCEALKHEKFLYLGKAAHYRTAEDSHALLAEKVEELVSREHAKWVSSRQAPGKRNPGREAS
jgi:hypothetical protein